MYFEDVLKVAAKYWHSPIAANKISDYYFEHVDNAWKELDDNYKYWVELLNWSIGVMISKISDNVEQDHPKTVSFKEISVVELEKRFNEIDLQGDSWDKERKEYQGFRKPPEINQLLTDDYMNNL